MADERTLDPLALALYRALLRFPDLSDGDLAAELGLSVDTLREQTMQLERLGFVSLGEGVGLRAAAQPDSAMAGYAASVWKGATDQVAELARLTALLAELNADFEAGRQRTGHALEFEIVPGSDAASRKQMELMDQCRADYCFLTNVQGADPNVWERVPRTQHPTREPELEIIQRGGRVRHIHPAKVRSSPSWVADLETDSANGVEVRLAAGDDIPPMTAIFDREVAMVPVDLRRTSTGAVVVRSQSLVASLRWLFETYRRQCTPFVIDAGQDHRRREILRLLSVGSKDEAIARSVGVGLRTIRREIADLMDELGAGSRFQLGLLAAKQGLVD